MIRKKNTSSVMAYIKERKAGGKPCWVFHGSDLSVLPAIEQDGLVPGDPSRHGSAYETKAVYVVTKKVLAWYWAYVSLRRNQGKDPTSCPTRQDLEQLVCFAFDLNDHPFGIDPYTDFSIAIEDQVYPDELRYSLIENLDDCINAVKEAYKKPVDKSVDTRQQRAFKTQNSFVSLDPILQYYWRSLD